MPYYSISYYTLFYSCLLNYTILHCTLLHCTMLSNEEQYYDVLYYHISQVKYEFFRVNLFQLKNIWDDQCNPPCPRSGSVDTSQLERNPVQRHCVWLVCVCVRVGVCVCVWGGGG